MSFKVKLDMMVAKSIYTVTSVIAQCNSKVQEIAASKKPEVDDKMD